MAASGSSVILSKRALGAPVVSFGGFSVTAAAKKPREVSPAVAGGYWWVLVVNKTYYWSQIKHTRTYHPQDFLLPAWVSVRAKGCFVHGQRRLLPAQSSRSARRSQRPGLALLTNAGPSPTEVVLWDRGHQPHRKSDESIGNHHPSWYGGNIKDMSEKPPTRFCFWQWQQNISRIKPQFHSSVLLTHRQRGDPAAKSPHALEGKKVLFFPGRTTSCFKNILFDLCKTQKIPKIMKKYLIIFGWSVTGEHNRA